jgi:hypothetical protein
MINFTQWLIKESNQAFAHHIISSHFTDRNAMAIYADWLEDHEPGSEEVAEILRHPDKYWVRMSQPLRKTLGGPMRECPFLHFPIAFFEDEMEENNKTPVKIVPGGVRLEVRGTNVTGTRSVNIEYHEHSGFTNNFLHGGVRPLPQVLIEMGIEVCKLLQPFEDGHDATE